ncbi:hypothetical protein [Bacteroides faecalis]|uniref:hypothetical protein n=1 Tax=Bacteroides faecalis TaxID=2447885 RepID=UPI000F626EBA|nr:hypothetical protein [Bacteroides faecalis]
MEAESQHAVWLSCINGNVPQKMDGNRQRANARTFIYQLRNCMKIINMIKHAGIEGVCKI